MQQFARALLYFRGDDLDADFPELRRNRPNPRTESRRSSRLTRRMSCAPFLERLELGGALAGAILIRDRTPPRRAALAGPANPGSP
jgi:hypothetical protein